MKCPICYGKGRIQDHKYNEEHTIEYLVYCEKKCEYCNGTGEVNEPLQTNDEWRRTCSTEEFIKWIVGVCHLAVLESTYDVAQLRKKRYWEIWLEEEHVEGVGGSNNDDA